MKKTQLKNQLELTSVCSLGLEVAYPLFVQFILFIICIDNITKNNLDGRLTDEEKKYAKEEFVKVRPKIVNKFARTDPGPKFWKFDPTQTQENTQLDK